MNIFSVKVINNFIMKKDHKKLLKVMRQGMKAPPDGGLPAVTELCVCVLAARM